MGVQRRALRAELLKIKYSPIIWITFAAFALAPIMGAVFMIIMRNPETLAKASGLNAKAQMMNISASWNSYFGILTQAVGVGGVLIFGFVSSWIFGREYSDGTAKDLLSLPISKSKILNAKFVIYVAWCFVLVLSNLIIGVILGLILKLPSFDSIITSSQLTDYFITTVITVLIGTPIAFFAIWGKGYLAPLGFVALTLVIAQIIGATGYGAYFPWSIPGLYSGAGGEYKNQLSSISYLILLATCVLGYLATTLYWQKADQTK